MKFRVSGRRIVSARLSNFASTARRCDAICQCEDQLLYWSCREMGMGDFWKWNYGSDGWAYNDDALWRGSGFEVVNFDYLFGFPK